MVKRVLLPILVLATGVVSTLPAKASKGLSPGDQIVRDYSKATGFRQWTETLTKHSVPGDYPYLEQVYKAYPELTKSDSLPKLNFEKDTFQIRDGLSVVAVQYYPGQPYTYSINGQKTEFSRYDLPSQKMKKILGVIKKGSQAGSFLLLPIAWAQDSHLPTRSSIIAFSIISATTSMLLPNVAPYLSNLLEKAKDTSAWKSVSKNVACIQKINAVEDVVHGQQQLDFKSMECSSLGLKIHLVEDQEHSYEKNLVIEPEGFYIEEAQPNHTTVTSHYTLVQPDPKTKGLDDPNSLSSSPYQRDQMGGQFVPEGGASREVMESYMGVATPDVRNFCASECADTLKSVWKVLHAFESKGSSGPSSRTAH